MVKIITMRQIGHFCDIACKYDDSECFYPNQNNIRTGYNKVAEFLEEKGKKIKELDWEEMFFVEGNIMRPALYHVQNCLVENKGEWRTTHLIRLVGYSPSIENLVQQIEQQTEWYNYQWSKEIKSYDKKVDITQYASFSQLEEEILHNNQP